MRTKTYPKFKKKSKEKNFTKRRTTMPSVHTEVQSD